MFRYAIVRTPCRKITEGITSAPELGIPDYDKALRQHEEYIAALRTCGLAVTVLPADEDFPDSCFVEDTSVLTGSCAIITNPGAPSRKGETESVIGEIRKFYSDDKIAFIKDPGTLEGGDVMMVGSHFYVGRSARTNAEGIRQFIGILESFGMTGSEVALNKVLHIKTGINYLENNNMLVSGEFTDKPDFSAYIRHSIPEGESYAANCLWINGTVIVPKGYPQTERLVKSLGYKVITVDTSEFRKIDGGLSCLSLRF
ncbi:MAG: N(G),N(G)-dimethylarginine dimethylaminohydrolase [Clostridiales bacterium]|nr:N(G),N(G)-dimethylarginine dimethylaminohydrolase [Clostridiales bacterium]